MPPLPIAGHAPVVLLNPHAQSGRQASAVPDRGLPHPVVSRRRAACQPERRPCPANHRLARQRPPRAGGGRRRQPQPPAAGPAGRRARWASSPMAAATTRPGCRRAVARLAGLPLGLLAGLACRMDLGEARIDGEWLPFVSSVTFGFDSVVGTRAQRSPAGCAACLATCWPPWPSWPTCPTGTCRSRLTAARSGQRPPCWPRP